MNLFKHIINSIISENDYGLDIGDYVYVNDKGTFREYYKGVERDGYQKAFVINKDKKYSPLQKSIPDSDGVTTRAYYGLEPLERTKSFDFVHNLKKSVNFTDEATVRTVIKDTFPLDEVLRLSNEVEDIYLLKAGSSSKLNDIIQDAIYEMLMSKGLEAKGKEVVKDTIEKKLYHIPKNIEWNADRPCDPEKEICVRELLGFINWHLYDYYANYKLKKYIKEIRNYFKSWIEVNRGKTVPFSVSYIKNISYDPTRRTSGRQASEYISLRGFPGLIKDFHESEFGKRTIENSLYIIVDDSIDTNRTLKSILTSLLDTAKIKYKRLTPRGGKPHKVKLSVISYFLFNNLARNYLK